MSSPWTSQRIPEGRGHRQRRRCALELLCQALVESRVERRSRADPREQVIVDRRKAVVVAADDERRGKWHSGRQRARSSHWQPQMVKSPSIGAPPLLYEPRQKLNSYGDIITTRNPGTGLGMPTDLKKMKAISTQNYGLEVRDKGPDLRDLAASKSICERLLPTGTGRSLRAELCMKQPRPEVLF